MKEETSYFLKAISVLFIVIFAFGGGCILGFRANIEIKQAEIKDKNKNFVPEMVETSLAGKRFLVFHDVLLKDVEQKNVYENMTFIHFKAEDKKFISMSDNVESEGTWMLHDGKLRLTWNDGFDIFVDVVYNLEALKIEMRYRNKTSYLEPFIKR